MDLLNLHHNAKYWPDPNTFNPDRFYSRDEAGAHVVDSPPAFMPFGSGPHHCLGRFVALRTACFTLASLCQRYHMELVDKENIVPRVLITFVPHGLKVKLTPR